MRDTFPFCWMRAWPGCHGDIDPKTELSETYADADFINLVKGHLDRYVFEVISERQNLSLYSVGRTIFPTFREGVKDTPNSERIVSLFFQRRKRTTPP